MAKQNEIFATLGIKEFVPNVRVVYRERTYTPPENRNLFSNPLYGSADKEAMMEDELDERAYERTILRHSPFFERMKSYRRQVAMSGPYILGETTVNDVPDYRGREILCEAMLGFTAGRAGDKKWLLIPGEGAIEVHSDGTLRLIGANPIIPYISLEDGRETCSTVSPITDAFTMHGTQGERMCRMYSAENFYDSLTESGGKLSYSYTTFSNGVQVEKLTVEIEVFPMMDEIEVESTDAE